MSWSFFSIIPSGGKTVDAVKDKLFIWSIFLQKQTNSSILLSYYHVCDQMQFIMSVSFVLDVCTGESSGDNENKSCQLP